MTTIELFSELYLPKRPYSTDALSKGIKRRERSAALEHLFIESNPKQMKNLITVDIDSSSASWDLKSKAYDDETIPAPLFITTNPQTGHSHAGWMIDGYASSPKALHSFGLIKDALTQLTGGDRAYTGLLVRNPLHPGQITEWDESGANLSLAEIRKYTDSVKLEKRGAPLAGEGRNRELFDKGRTFAYSEIYKLYKGTSLTPNRSLGDSVFAFIMQMNLKLFPVPLSTSEITTITRSIVTWTERHVDPRKIEAKQEAGRKKATITKQSKAREKYLAIKEFKEAGITVKDACEQLGLKYPSVRASWRNWEEKYS